MPLKKDMWRKQLTIGLARAYRRLKLTSTFYIKTLLHLNVFMTFCRILKAVTLSQMATISDFDNIWCGSSWPHAQPVCPGRDILASQLYAPAATNFFRIRNSVLAMTQQENVPDNVATNHLGLNKESCEGVSQLQKTIPRRCSRNYQFQQG